MSFAELLQSPATSKNLVFEKFDFTKYIFRSPSRTFSISLSPLEEFVFSLLFLEKTELSLPLNLWGLNCCLFPTLVTWDSQVFSNPCTAIDQLPRIDMAHDPL